MSYRDLEKSALRRDWVRNIGYTNEVALLDCGIKEWAHYFVDPDVVSNVPLKEFITVSEDVDPQKGWGLTLTGFTLGYDYSRIPAGSHLIARVHDEIPQITINVHNLFTVRNTYSIREDDLTRFSNKQLTKFYESQLAAFAKSATNWIRFLSYEIFADLGAENGQISEELKNPFFEEYKTEIYSPANAQTNGYPFMMVSLTLEQVIDKDYKQLKNRIKEQVTHIRSVLTTHKVTYNKGQPKYQHDIPEAAKAAFALREKISEVCRKMQYNSTQYRLTESNKKGFMINIDQSDLIVLMNLEDQIVLEDTVPELVAPGNYGFTASTLYCGKVIFVPYVKQGTALVIHKDALKFIIVKNTIGNAPYVEPGITNRFHTLSWMMDVVELYPCAFIKPA